MMWGAESGWGWGLGWLLHGLLPLAILALLVWAVVVLARNAGGQVQPRGDRALSILRERYARGELTREEFESMRRDLTE